MTIFEDIATDYVIKTFKQKTSYERKREDKSCVGMT